MNISVVGCVFVVSQKEFTTNYFCIGKNVAAFGYKFCPVFQYWIVDISHHNPVFRSTVIGKYIHFVTDNLYRRILVIKVGSQLYKWCI